MSTYPKSPREMTGGMMYFPRMLDKIRLHPRGELGEDYHKNLGAVKAADGACCNFLRVHYRDLRERVLQGGTDDEILEWCFEKGRRLNEGDIVVWNGFASKLGWRDFMTPRFQELKKAQGVTDREDIACVPDLMDFEEGRTKQRITTAASVLSSSDLTGFVTVARGTDESGKDTIVISRGKPQTEADNSTLELLNAAGIGVERKIVYRYFSHGADSK